MTLQDALFAIPILLLCSAVNAAVLPLDKPSMAVKVEAGKYVVRGKTIEVEHDVELSIEPPERVVVKGEEIVLTDEKPQVWHLGTALKKTLGPVDTGTRLPKAIVPESVKVYADGTVYEEGKDYFLDHDWGGLCRLEGGSIPKDSKVMVDYEVYLQRVDAVQVQGGVASIKKGEFAPICPDIPQAGIANVYVPFRTTAITAGNICPMPSKDISWMDFVKVSGGEYLSNTLHMLKAGEPVTVVCWGDSVTCGGSAVPYERSYVELFRARLKAAYPNASITLTNAGIGGSNTDSRRDGFEKEVLALSPDLITVEFVNDAGMSSEKIRTNWDEFIARARAENPKVEFILITPHFVMPEWMGNFDKSIAAMRQAASDNKVALADTTYIWENLRSLGIPYETLEANGINHPNNLGHEFFAECLMRLMRP
jgi:lysophospholipase L1-like esterase